MKRIATILIMALACAGFFCLKGGSVMAEDRYEKGLKQLRTLNPEGTEQTLNSLKDIAPDMGRLVVEFPYGDVYSRPGLDIKSRQIATIAALTALGNASPQLKWHMNGALNVGVTPGEIVETLYVVTVYAGFPAGLNAISTAREVFKARSIAYSPPKEAGASDRRAKGLKTMEETSKGSGKAVLAGLADVAPAMADFIIDFSYGDVFSRPGLSPRLREIAAIAATTARGTMAPQLKVHIKAARNVGVTKEEIIEVITQMAVYAGFPAALNGISAAREAFSDGK